MLESPAKVSGPSRLVGYAGCFRDTAARLDVYPYRNCEQASVKQSVYKFGLHLVRIFDIPRRTRHRKQVAHPVFVSLRQTITMFAVPDAITIFGYQ
jgi:hypothetical protein